MYTTKARLLHNHNCCLFLFLIPCEGFSKLGSDGMKIHIVLVRADYLILLFVSSFCCSLAAQLAVCQDAFALLSYYKCFSTV